MAVVVAVVITTKTKQPGPASGPCCVTDCCQSGCEECPYDYKNSIDPNIPPELSTEPFTEDPEDF
jgi:hypothetical protein